MDVSTTTFDYSPLLPLIKNRDCAKILGDQDLFFLSFILSDFQIKNGYKSAWPAWKTIQIHGENGYPVPEIIQSAQNVSEKFREAFNNINDKESFTINKFSVKIKNETVYCNTSKYSSRCEYPYLLARNLIRLAAFSGFTCSIQGIYKEENPNVPYVDPSNHSWYENNPFIIIKGTLTPIDRRILELYQLSQKNMGCPHLVQASDGTPFHIHASVYPKTGLPRNLQASAELVSAYVKFLYLGQMGFQLLHDSINCTKFEFKTFCETYELVDFNKVARKYVDETNHPRHTDLFWADGSLKIDSPKRELQNNRINSIILILNRVFNGATNFFRRYVI